VRLSVISASVSSVPWMRIDTCCLEPRVVSVRFAENTRSMRQSGSRRPNRTPGALRRGPCYDVLNDFEPISLIVDSLLIVARRSMPKGLERTDCVAEG
jgi:hypothetical protein